MTTRRIVTFALVTTAIALPAIAAAQTSNGIQNPLNAAYSSIPEFISGFLKVMVMIGLPVVGLYTLLAGFQFISAQGNPNKIGDAKRNFMFVIIGAALILGAWVLATLIGNTVSNVVGPAVNL
jgi:hypothetical protein